MQMRELEQDRARQQKELDQYLAELTLE
jgi:hypothetical protein